MTSLLLIGGGVVATLVLTGSPLKKASMTAEAAGDLLVPVGSYWEKRSVREAVRQELTRILEFQDEQWADSARYADVHSLPTLSKYLVVELSADQKARRWLAWVGHQRLPLGEGCGVAVGYESAYVGGIPLPRERRVRCSWDLATRLNRVMN